MKTVHKVLNCSSIDLSKIENESIDLVVTSPPYPMIEMWDDCFKQQSDAVCDAFELEMFHKAWLEMHYVLKQVWNEVIRVVKPGGFVCINIGDATRTINNNFQLYSNHSKIITYFINNGFYCLPDILWRKRTNSPNKFMGSGMLPSGAYVTLEHEYILIFRKGNKRDFDKEDKIRRQKSAYFYQERNEWFSDVWDVMGTSQKGIKGSRERNGSYPVEIPYRLISMYSMQEDVVLDPFAGLGSTMMAAIMLGRNSINVELDSVLCEYMKRRVLEYKDFNEMYRNRIENQKKFIKAEQEKGKQLYYNDKMKLFVKTKQEQNMELVQLECVKEENNNIVCEYK